MKRITLLLSLLFILGSGLWAQNCASMYPLSEGLEMEVTSYDAKDKVTGTSKTRVLEKWEEGGAVHAKMETESFNTKGESEMTLDFEVSCADGNFQMSIEAFVPSGQMSAMEGMEVEVSGDPLDFPKDMHVGQVLNDGELTISASQGGMNFEILCRVYDRKITAKETLSTPMGNLECYKLEFWTHVKIMGMGSPMKTVMYIHPGMGAVRTESYSKKGKLTSYSLMTGFKS